jgi:hypothetical protein
MKKIGVLTYIKEFANHGTNMQSYSTLKAIQNTFPEDRVELINYSGWKPIMKPYFSNMTVSSLLKDFSRIKKYKKFFREDLILSEGKLISANLPESIRFIKDQKYDALYVGADTLLELKRANKNELTAYWLDETVKSKKFLIAASANNVVFETLTVSQKDNIQKTIDDFSLLGVRDEPTYRLLSNFVKTGDNRLKLVPDPTFTYDIDYSFADKYVVRKKLNLHKPIVCFHLTRGALWAKELATYFRKEGYRIASFRPAYYADIILSDLSAFEQAGIYKYFNLVITHRFHDSIFSVKNLTPVIFFPEHTTDVTMHNESKTLTLFKSFDIDETNYINNKDQISANQVFEMHKLAIQNFKNKTAFIKSVLVKNKKEYELYLDETREIVNSSINC